MHQCNFTDEGQHGGIAAELFVMVLQIVGPVRIGRAGPARPGPRERAEEGRGLMTRVLPDGLAELLQTCFLVLIAGGHDLVQQIGVRADRALTEDHQVAGQDVRAFHRDGHRHGAVKVAQIVLRTIDHRLAGVNVHRVIGRLA